MNFERARGAAFNHDSQAVTKAATHAPHGSIHGAHATFVICRRLIVLPVTRLSAAHGITSTATQEEAALLAASKESALGAALAAGKSGLCGHLCWHLDSLSRQVAELQIKGDRKSHTEV